MVENPEAAAISLAVLFVSLLLLGLMQVSRMADAPKTNSEPSTPAYHRPRWIRWTFIAVVVGLIPSYLLVNFIIQQRHEARWGEPQPGVTVSVERSYGGRGGGLDFDLAAYKIVQVRLGDGELKNYQRQFGRTPEEGEPFYLWRSNDGQVWGSAFQNHGPPYPHWPAILWTAGIWAALLAILYAADRVIRHRRRPQPAS
jgi:hypothetical protein